MRPTYLEVNLSQLEQNLAAIRSQVHPAKVMVILKANAYGHGVEGVAPFFAPKADYLGVALVEEALHLRRLGISTPILVLGGILPEQLPDFFDNGLTLTVASPMILDLAQVMAVSRGKRLKVHLKIDTGMERLGVREYEAEPFIIRSAACSQLEVEGIFTHFANAEAKDQSHPRLQLDRFQRVLSVYEKRSIPRPKLVHAANSAAVLALPESRFDMVRPGILFYGVYPARDIEKPIQVLPAIKWKSRVVHSKVTQPDRPVSYGSLWKPGRETRILTIPCGYADGYFRRMSTQAQVLIGGKRYPQVGRICMDQLMVNAGSEDIPAGEEVLLLGDDLTVEELSDWTGTNEYEVLTSIGTRVPRSYVRE
ncbi:MAG: alanine racemase [Chloroflexi bacterium]|nr:alanine racemase [Chloroflexota bacterium]